MICPRLPDLIDLMALLLSLLSQPLLCHRYIMKCDSSARCLISTAGTCLTPL